MMNVVIIQRPKGSKERVRAVGEGREGEGHNPGKDNLIRGRCFLLNAMVSPATS